MDEDKTVSPPPQTFEHVEKATESVRGSAFADAQPIQAAPAPATQIPQALLGTPAASSTTPAADGGDA